MENYFEIGKITGTHGIRGTMRVFPTTQDPTRFERLKEITVEIRGKQELFHIQKVAYQKNMILLTVKEINDINVAELYKNGRILIPMLLRFLWRRMNIIPATSMGCRL